jgi:alpha-galactosidase
VAPRIVVIGGGSYQWVPKLLVDLVNTPSLARAQVVLEDVDPGPLPGMEALGRRLAALAGTGMRFESTTDQRAALAGADYVVVTISTGGFSSMRHDLEVPARHGIRQSVGDTVGPGGISRALRNIPVLLAIAADMEELCPDAWLLNITNPMTTLCRALTRCTSIRTVGLCHEIALTRYTLSQLLGVDFRAIDLTVAGVNHLPFVTAIDAGGADGFDLLRALLDDAARAGEEPVPAAAREGPAAQVGRGLRKRDLLAANRVKLALFERFGVLPAAGDRHLVEFFPGFLTEESGWGSRWGVTLTTIADREDWLRFHRAEFDRLRALDAVPAEPSGEIVAPLVDAFERGLERTFPCNLPNEGQVPDVPDGAVVEAMCTTRGRALVGRDRPHLPPTPAEWLRRVVASQEATVDAALAGDRDRVVEAMLLDPLAGRVDLDRLVQMTDDLLRATAPWLPQFA